jgi:hypothetical protein
MRTVYDIIRVYPNKSTEKLQTINSLADIDHLVETPQFVGTWINSSRKLLRYGRGEIRIQPRIEEQQLGDRATIEVDGIPAFVCSVTNSDDINFVVISQKSIAGFVTLKQKPLWTVGSITELSGFIDKNLAYQCALAYDTLVETNNLKAYM